MANRVPPRCPQGSSCFSVQRPPHAQACLHQPQCSQGSLFLKARAKRSPQTDHPSHHREARQTSVRAPPRFAARWDSHHLEIPRDTSPYCLHSALLSASPACYLQPLYDHLFAHNPRTTDPFAALSTCTLFFDSARRPSNTHHHLTLSPAATPLRNHESRVVSTPFMAVALFMRCRCIHYIENEHY